MKPTVYIETTVVSYLTAWPSRDIVRAAHQQVTRDWWDRAPARFELFSSVLVVAECLAGDSTAATARKVVLDTLPLLEQSAEAEALAESLVRKLAIPPKAIRDAAHVAIAATNGIEYLLTWNCRHLANLHQRGQIERACREHGFEPPAIGTPIELQEYHDD
jgi:predicted nucleic acid-binding protein